MRQGQLEKTGREASAHFGGMSFEKAMPVPASAVAPHDDADRFPVLVPSFFILFTTLFLTVFTTWQFEFIAVVGEKHVLGPGFTHTHTRLARLPRIFQAWQCFVPWIARRWFIYRCILLSRALQQAAFFLKGTFCLSALLLISFFNCYSPPACNLRQEGPSAGWHRVVVFGLGRQAGWLPWSHLV